MEKELNNQADVLQSILASTAPPVSETLTPAPVASAPTLTTSVAPPPPPPPPSRQILQSPPPPNKPKMPSKANDIVIKALLLFAMLLVMQIPIYLIMDLVESRESSYKSVDEDTIRSWGGEAVVTTPRIFVSSGNYPNFKKTTPIIYNDLNITADIVTQELKRGIFSTTVFKANVKYLLTPSEADGFDKQSASVVNPYIFLFIPASITKQKITPTALLNGSELSILSNNCSAEKFGRGILYSIPYDKIVNAKGWNIEISSDVTGSEKLTFSIKDQQAHIQTTSKWQSPNFNGDILPDNRTVSSDGFTATWVVSKDFSRSEFGVELIVPVNPYRLIHRAAKYALLFIAMTFAAFFIVETVNKWRIHPIQYFLVGAAMVVFYSLLLSFSEQIAFGWAYLISSGATVILISMYTFTILRQSIKSALIIPALLVSLYLFLYFILQMQDYSLIAGSILLFVTVGIAMFSLRNIKWYGETKE